MKSLLGRTRIFLAWTYVVDFCLVDGIYLVTRTRYNPPAQISKHAMALSQTDAE